MSAQENSGRPVPFGPTPFWAFAKRSARISASIPCFLRVPFAASVLISPTWAIGAYFALGASRPAVAAALPEAAHLRRG